MGRHQELGCQHSSSRKTCPKTQVRRPGKSKIHANSKRAAILKHIQAAPACTVSIADLDAAFGEPTRGYVHKLIEMNHLESVDAE